MYLNKVFNLINLIISVWIINYSEGHFNLYLTHAEVKRLLGLPAELFYVREGVVNDYALRYKVPIQADVHSLYFTWQALTKKPVLYNIAIWTNSSDEQQEPVSDALYDPTVNISLTGNIPTNPTTFLLQLPCTGRISAVVDVTLNINVTSPRPDEPPTVIFFRRKKICLKGKSAENFQPRQDPDDEETSMPDLPALYYAVSGVVGVTLVFILIFVAVLYRKKSFARKKNIKNFEIGSVSVISTKDQPNTTSSSFFDSFTPNNNMYALPSSVTVNSYASLHKVPGSYFTPTMSAYSHSCDHSPVNTYTYAHPMDSQGSESPSSMDDSSSNLHKPDDSSLETANLTAGRHSYVKHAVIFDPAAVDFRERFKMLQIDRQRIRITSVLTEGLFGKVYRGCVQGDKRSLDQQVIIKTVKEGSPIDEETRLCKEGSRLFNFIHRNIQSVAGMSFCDQVPPYLIYGDIGSTNLKNYLQSHRDKPLKASEVVSLGLDAVNGLAFIHSANSLHADVAARNCIVDEHLHLRLTDSALAHDLFSEDYVAVGCDSARPIKWMAYEVLTDRLVSTASDVWSYGVLLWELTTQGQQPYEDVPAKELQQYLRDGYRLAQPRQCPDDLYKLMAFCWAAQPYDRPRAEQVLSYMKDFQNKLKHFV